MEIIRKKRDGGTLSPEEISFFVQGYNRDEIPDYQAAAWLMAVYFRGMEAAETAALTLAMADSGEKADLAAAAEKTVDKHSTGGVGDKTTLVLLPLVAAAGVRTAKLSGRGLGHTGGTVDKLSCIPGFRTELGSGEFLAQVRDLGVAVTGQSPKLAPADGKLYALRDVTATVDCIPLIASSIMSKKIASGARNIVLDVKTGSGAFMRQRESALALAETMVAIGRDLGRRTVALITAMDQPLGRAVGNHLEVIEAIETLRGRGPADLVELCLRLGAEMMLLAGLARSGEEACARLAEKLKSGEALDMMRRWIFRQGGDARVVDEPELLGTPPFRAELTSPAAGWLARLDALTVGQASVLLGAGRAKKGEEVDLLAGILLLKKTGDRVRKGEVLAEIFCSDGARIAPALEMLAGAYGFAPEAPAAMPLLLDRIDWLSLRS